MPCWWDHTNLLTYQKFISYEVLCPCDSWIFSRLRRRCRGTERRQIHTVERLPEFSAKHEWINTTLQVCIEEDLLWLLAQNAASFYFGEYVFGQIKVLKRTSTAWTFGVSTVFHRKHWDLPALAGNLNSDMQEVFNNWDIFGIDCGENWDIWVFFREVSYWDCLRPQGRLVTLLHKQWLDYFQK